MEFAQFELLQTKRNDAKICNDMVQYWLYDALICHDLGMPDTAIECLDNARKAANVTRIKLSGKIGGWQ